MRAYPNKKLPIVLILMAGTLAACGRGNMEPVKAIVGTVDRTCTFKGKGQLPKKLYCGDSESLTTDPNIYKDGKRIASVKGSAVVSLMYTAPDGTSQAGSTEISANKDLYYTLKAGDEVTVLVDRDNPAKFILE